MWLSEYKIPDVVFSLGVSIAVGKEFKIVEWAIHWMLKDTLWKLKHTKDQQYLIIINDLLITL